MHLPTLVSDRTKRIDQAIEFWISRKRKPGRTSRTPEIYEDYICKLRAALNSAGYDLDGLPLTLNPTPQDKEESLVKLSLMIELWAAHATKPKQKEQGVKATTFNQRLSAISNFYAVTGKRGFLAQSNPVDLIDRVEVQDYEDPVAFSNEEVKAILGSMDRKTLAGKRDYALFLVFLTTGRRSAEVLGMKWGDIDHIDGKRMLIHFHCKGGVEMRDILADHTQKALEDYLTTLFAGPLEPDQSLWLSFSNRRPKQPLTARGLADIFQVRAGTKHIHRTRHTFALMMLEAGATVREIQEKLGHKSVATTERYLKRLRRPENKYLPRMMAAFGVE